MVRQSCASDPSNQWTSVDLDGLPWTGRCGLKDRTHPHRSGSPTRNRFVERRGRDSSP